MQALTSEYNYVRANLGSCSCKGLSGKLKFNLDCHDFARQRLLSIFCLRQLCLFSPIEHYSDGIIFSAPIIMPGSNEKDLGHQESILGALRRELIGKPRNHNHGLPKPC